MDNGYNPALFSARLREIRTAKNMTQKELAAHLGCRSGTVNNWEHMFPNISLYYFVRVAEVLGVSLEELAGLK
jgi:transcriptional regulator with XRE-family HTH domain